jgi:putative NADH-flavin reductase
MDILVIGARHGLGAEVVRQAGCNGLRVAAFSGDVLDPDTVAAQVAGHDAVISTLGPRMGSAPDLCSRGTANVVAAMRTAGPRRLVVVSGAMIGHAPDRLGLVYRMIQRQVPDDMLRDRRAAEAVVEKSGLDWTLIRPTRLTDGPALGRWRDSGTARIGAFARISRKDAAAAILQTLDRPETVRRALTLQY